ncbi:MAG: transcription termination factor Rho [Candidatus Microthrix sp.]|jgi:transcription termination factor Rho|nr:transcription termination factor Rho [Candidatus Microthrix sp.]MBP9066441.1 transcription termination factor Rho [Candidatus Microthrix sp.]
MADDSIDLERSKLEGKDRAQLVTIATALGTKPPARAKKADIVDLILRLAGVDEAPPVEADPTKDDASDDGAPSKAPASTAAASSDEASADEDDRSQAGQAAGGRGNDRSGGNASQRRGARAPAGGRPNAEDQANGDSRTKGEQPKVEQPKVDQGRDGQPRDGQGRVEQGNGADDVNGNRADGGAPQAEDDEDDDGNRRRRGRRRGRNRDEDDAQWEGEPVEVAGFLDLRDEGYGFLRVKGYLPSREDVYISAKMVRQNGLRKGDHVTGAYRPAGGREKNPALLRVDKVMDLDPEQARQRPRFDDLTPVYPHQRVDLTLGDDSDDATARAIDLLAPIGLGQRGLIVAPPRSGATTVLASLARAIEAATPDAHVMMLLIDERPEEITGLGELTRGEVIASSFERPPEEHTHVVELTLERAKRLVELGNDVVILLDGITRLVRAYSAVGQPSGRTLPGGIDSAALFPPKRFLGAARSLNEPGSLTILATLRSDAATAADDLVWAEFAGTANMEVHLNRRAADWQVFPALEVEETATRHLAELVEESTAEQVRALRRHLTALNESGSPLAGLEWLVEAIEATPDNAALLAAVPR